MTLTLRYMKNADIKQVSAIDHASFQPPWPIDSYTFEINQSNVSHMVVLEDCITYPLPASADEKPNLWSHLKQLLHREETFQRQQIVGYGGLWKIADEAHISTIASHPDFRGQGYGEILLAGMVGKALSLEADYIVLEVRVSNHVAQNLYRKYGFTQHGIKEDYYRSDKEDAYDMRVIFDDGIATNFKHLYQQLQTKHQFDDQYTDTGHPRRST